MKQLGFVRKWIKGECRHFCNICKYKEECNAQMAEEEKVRMCKEDYSDYSDKFNDKT